MSRRNKTVLNETHTIKIGKGKEAGFVIDEFRELLDDLGENGDRIDLTEFTAVLCADLGGPIREHFDSLSEEDRKERIDTIVEKQKEPSPREMLDSLREEYADPNADPDNIQEAVEAFEEEIGSSEDNANE
jgi:DNA-binding transcriptional MerR regulator